MTLFDTGEPPRPTEPMRGGPPTKAERIYNAYPKKVSKGPAILAICKALKAVDFDLLLTATKAYARSVKHIQRGSEEWRRVPYPATWFNAQKWLDDPRDLITHEQVTPTSQPNMPTDDQQRRRRAQEAAEATTERREQEAAEAYVDSLSDQERISKASAVVEAETSLHYKRRLWNVPAAMNRAIWRMHQQETANDD